MSKVYGADSLNLRAEAHAIPAQYALVRITHQRDRGEVQFLGLMHGFEAHLPDAQFAGDVLELAGGALRAGRALLVMVGQQQFDGDLPNLADLLGLRAHFQPRLRGS